MNKTDKFFYYSAHTAKAIITSYSQITNSSILKKTAETVSNTHKKIKEVVATTFGNAHVDFNMKVLYAVPVAFASDFITPYYFPGVINFVAACSICLFPKWNDETKLKAIHTIAIAHILELYSVSFRDEYSSEQSQDFVASFLKVASACTQVYIQVRTLRGILKLAKYISKHTSPPLPAVAPPQ